MFESLTDEQLIERRAILADTCIRVLAMPDDVRTATGPKGQASPEQAGSLTAMFAWHAMQECERRGIA